LKLAKKVSLSVIGVIAICGSLLGGLTWYENLPLEGTGTVRMVISSGEALGQTARNLESAGLIRSAGLFKLVEYVDGVSLHFPQGTFEVPRGLSVFEMARWFKAAAPVQVKVTLPEGWTSTQIARLLDEAEIVAATEFLQFVDQSSAEGTLFPDTYLFPLHISASEVVRRMQQNYFQRTRSLTQGMDQEAVNRNLIMASIIEKEYRVPEEAATISSVFWNRLDQGIPLGSCATIEYILTEIQGRAHPKRIYFVHTTIPSPFNTYLNKGLPPQPICNPGLTALEAAFHPAKTKFLYFVVANPVRGSHTFSSSYDDHEKARELYLDTFVSKG
jgi:UPF0755 protein